MQVTADGHDPYPRAIRKVLGTEVEHRDNAPLHRRIEQDHRGIKQRYDPMLGFCASPRHNASVVLSKKSVSTFVRDGNGNSLSLFPVVGGRSFRKYVCYQYSLLPPNTTTQRESHDPRQPCSSRAASPDTFVFHYKEIALSTIHC
jgi:hypothetical protein